MPSRLHSALATDALASAAARGAPHPLLDELARAHERRPGVGAARRSGFRGIGGGGAAEPAWTPASLTNLRGWYRADLGVTLVGSDVDAWADQSGHNNDFVAVSSGVRPLYAANDASFGGQPSITGDGVSEYLRCGAFDWGADVSEFTYISVARLITAATRSYVIASNGAGSARIAHQATSASKATVVTVGTGGATSTTVASWTTTPVVLWARRVGNTQSVGFGQTQEDSDFTTAVYTGADSVNGGPFSLFAASGGAGPINVGIAELVVMRAGITAGELASFHAYAQARYGVA